MDPQQTELSDRAELPTSMLATFADEERRDRARSVLGLVTALMLHFTVVTVLGAMPQEPEREYEVIACSLRPPQVYARPAVPRASTVRGAIPQLPRHGCSRPIIPPESPSTVEPESTVEPPSRSETEATRPLAELIPVSTPSPTCTEIARRARLQGLVLVRVTVGSDGLVSEVEPLKGMPFGLTDQVEKAVAGWRFEPWNEDEAPSAGMGIVSVMFRDCRVTLSGVGSGVPAPGSVGEAVPESGE